VVLFACAVCLWSLTAAAHAQQAPAVPADEPANQTTESSFQPPVAPQAQTAAPLSLSGYRIGPDDTLAVSVLQAQELNASVRVSPHGEISLPLLGTLRAGGMTPQELESEIERRLREKYIRDPDVTVLATDIRSQGISVVGAVRRPGVIQLRGSSTVLEAISAAGGIADDAGDTAVLVRNGSGDRELKLDAVLDGRDPGANPPVVAGDVLNVRTAAVVYVIGAVRKPGAFAMRGNSKLTVLRALALGEGLMATAATGDAVVLRTSPAGGRVEIPVDLRAVLQAKTADPPLQPQDVLFVPTSGGKAAALATIGFLSRAVSLRALLP
jgi:polysaccharide export outer membrane protein